MKNIAVFVAEKYEDTELITTLNILKRKNINFKIFSVENKTLVQGTNIALIKTLPLNEFKSLEFDGLFLPGGPGYIELSKNEFLINIIKDFNKQNKFLAAICAAPFLFEKANILNEDVIFTSHHSVCQNNKNNTGNQFEISKNIITGRDPESTWIFAKSFANILK